MRRSPVVGVVGLGCVILAVACGSSDQPAADAGVDQASGSSSSSSSGLGGSSSSGASSSSSSSGSASSSGGAGADAGIAVHVDPSACTKAADCTSPQVCCGALMLAGLGMVNLTTACQAGPCPVQFGVNAPVQFCAGDAECGAGSTCQPPPAAILAIAPGVASYQFCAPVADGGGSADAGDASADADASARLDATSDADATVPMDATGGADGTADEGGEGGGIGDAAAAGDGGDAGD